MGWRKVGEGKGGEGGAIKMKVMVMMEMRQEGNYVGGDCGGCEASYGEGK